MTPSQLDRREALLARQDTVLSRWPQGRDSEFMRQMARLAHDLEALAHEADAAGDEALERGRNWRYVGNAYADLAVGQEVDKLEPAANAYRRADLLLAAIDAPIERMKLDFSFGRALLRLSEGRHLALAREARDRFACALRIARTHMPAGVADAERALADAEEALALVQTAGHIDARIGELEQELSQEPHGDERAPAQSGWPDEFRGLFEQLRGVYAKDIEAGKVSEVRQQALNPVLDQLGDMLKYRPDDLGVKLSQGTELRELMARMAPLLGQTARQDSSPSESGEERAQAVWRRFAAIKTSLAQDMAKQHGGSETQFAAMELYRRCGHADTFLHQHFTDGAWVRDYEHDVLRQLAMDIRAHSLRNHLTLAQPIWPSQSLARDPSAVHYAGGNRVGRLLADACNDIGLTLRSRRAATDYAAQRWDELRASHVAVFDYTDYRSPNADRAVDLAAAAPLASVSYELGIALALGRPVLVVASASQELPFDVDITPLRLHEDGRDAARIADALDDVIYGVQRGGSGNSLPEARAHLRQRYADDPNVVVAQSLRLLDESVERDPVKFQRFVEPLLGFAGASAPTIVYPAWPGSYPSDFERRLFHVTAFGPEWAGDTMHIAAQACAGASPALRYIRGDKARDANIILSIWDNLCQASYVLVDLTGLNANVAVELGIAHTLGRRVLLVSQDAPVKEHFAALAKLRVHRYALNSTQGTASLRAILERALAE